MRYLVVSLLVVSLVGTPMVDAGVMLPGKEQQYLDFALDPMFQAAGGIETFSPTTGTRRGSAVLVQNSVGHVYGITAAHMFVGTAVPNNDVESAVFSLGTDLLNNPVQQIELTDWWVYPGYTGFEGGGQGVDVAVFKLESVAEGITAASLYRGEDERNTVIFTAGYGRPAVADELFGVTWLPVDQRKRAGSVLAENFGGDLGYSSVAPYYWIAEFNTGFGGGDVQEHEIQTSPGASGMPYYNELGEVIGINSFVYSHYGNWGASGGIRTGLFVDWFDSIIVPEPGTAAFFMVAATFLLRRKRSIA